MAPYQMGRGAHRGACFVEQDCLPPVGDDAAQLDWVAGALTAAIKDRFARPTIIAV